MNKLLNTFRNEKNSSFKPWEFAVVFLIIFFVACVFLFAIDFVPEAPGKTSNTSANIAEASVTLGASAPIVSAVSQGAPIAQASSEVQNASTGMPVRISIPKVGIDTIVSSPTSTNIQVLDNALLSGAVRYPGAVGLNESAPMLIFGHQSYLPVVRNQAFKAFNSLQNVSAGDDIIVSSATVRYHYRVTSIEYVDVATANVSIGGSARTLTLVTCDSFGKQKSKRYVVQAEFSYEEPIITRS